MSGVRCLGRAVLQGERPRLDIRGIVEGARGPVPVVFSHVRVVPDAEVRLVAVSLRRDGES